MFLKKTKRGGIIKIVREHYLRDDIWCGSELCSLCEHESPILQSHVSVNSTLCPYPHYIIPDTNVVLHQVRHLASYDDWEWAIICQTCVRIRGQIMIFLSGSRHSN